MFLLVASQGQQVLTVDKASVVRWWLLPHAGIKCRSPRCVRSVRIRAYACLRLACAASDLRAVLTLQVILKYADEIIKKPIWA